MEEHYAYVKEPDDIYVTQVTPDFGKSRCVTDEIITFLINSDSKISFKLFLAMLLQLTLEEFEQF